MQLVATIAAASSMCGNQYTLRVGCLALADIALRQLVGDVEARFQHQVLESAQGIQPRLDLWLDDPFIRSTDTSTLNRGLRFLFQWCQNAFYALPFAGVTWVVHFDPYLTAVRRLRPSSPAIRRSDHPRAFRLLIDV